MNGLGPSRYVGQVLVPPHCGRIMVLNNLTARKSATVRIAIEVRGASVLLSTPCSPDYNLLKFKSRLRKVEARTVETL